MKKFVWKFVLLLVILIFGLAPNGGCLGFLSSCIPDVNIPTVQITSPTEGSTVSGTVNIQATASDNVGVSRVVFYIDNVAVGEDTSSPYQYSWDTTTYTNGTHTLKAKAYDSAGNVGESVIVTVNVNNTPRAVLIDDVHQNENNFDGNTVTVFYATLMSKLQSMGYTVSLASIAGFNPSISNYGIVLLPAPFSSYSNSETQALVSFVNAGGKLIMQGEWYSYGYSANTNLNNLSIALQAGITFNMDTVYDDTNNYSGTNYWPLISDFVSHPTTTGLETIALIASCSLSVQTPAIPIAYASSSAYASVSLSRGNGIGIGLKAPEIKTIGGNIIVAAVAEIGAGKVIATGDVNLFCDDVYGISGGTPYINLYNNMTFFENIINW